MKIVTPYLASSGSDLKQTNPHKRCPYGTGNGSIMQLNATLVPRDMRFHHSKLGDHLFHPTPLPGQTLALA